MFTQLVKQIEKDNNRTKSKYNKNKNYLEIYDLYCYYKLVYFIYIYQNYMINYLRFEPTFFCNFLCLQV